MSKIVVLLGTTREGRASEGVAKYVAAELAKLGAEVELVDSRDILKNQPLTETDNEAWMAIAHAADGFVIVSPEYNHGYPGMLKMVLDGADEEYDKKPVGIVGVSSGPFGGIRMIEQIRQVCVELGLIGIYETLMFGFATKAVSADGTLLDPAFQPRMETFGKSIMWWADGLKKLREEA